MVNSKIRKTLSEKRMYQYELADLLGMSETTLIRRLRKELPDEEQDRIIRLIEDHCGGISHADS